MGELQKVLAGIKSKVSRYGTKGVNEQNTKATLIQPVLRSLGWDVEDLDDVHLEYKRKPKDKPVDYALLLMRTPCLFVEAKALGQNLDDRKWANQILGYASVAGVEWVVLTDGNEYRIYNSHATVPVEEKLFRKVCISDDSSNPADSLALLAKARMEEKRIDRLWAAHFIDRQVQAAVQELFATDPDPDAAFVRLLRKKLPSLTPNDIKAGLRRAEVRFEFPPAADLPEQETPTRTGRSEAAKKSWDTRRKAAKKAVDASPSRPQRDAPVMTSKAHVGVSLLDVINAGLLKVPLNLTKHYKGHDLEARLQTDGTVVFQGANFRSCSAAAEVARGTIIGGQPHTNGWTFWKYRDADGNLVFLDAARQAYIKRK